MGVLLPVQLCMDSSMIWMREKEEKYLLLQLEFNSNDEKRNTIIFVRKIQTVTIINSIFTKYAVKYSCATITI